MVSKAILRDFFFGLLLEIAIKICKWVEKACLYFEMKKYGLVPKIAEKQNYNAHCVEKSTFSIFSVPMMLNETNKSPLRLDRLSQAPYYYCATTKDLSSRHSSKH